MHASKPVFEIKGKGKKKKAKEQKSLVRKISVEQRIRGEKMQSDIKVALFNYFLSS